MELIVAKAIIQEAVVGDFVDENNTPIDSDKEVIDYAIFLAKEAQKVYNAGVKNNETINAIISLAKEPDNLPEQTAQEDNGAGTGSSAFSKDSYMEMPADVSLLDDLQVRKYHGLMNSYFGKARLQLAEEESLMVQLKHLRDAEFRHALLEANNLNVLRETKKTVSLLEAEAQTNEQVTIWNSKYKEHEANVIKLKALAEIYSRNVEVLSREATIRHNEYERSR